MMWFFLIFGIVMSIASIYHSYITPSYYRQIWQLIKQFEFRQAIILTKVHFIDFMSAVQTSAFVQAFMCNWLFEPHTAFWCMFKSILIGFALLIYISWIRFKRYFGLI